MLYVSAFEQAINNCDSALKIDPNSAKGLYRRAFSNMAIGEADKVIFGSLKLLALATVTSAHTPSHAF